MFHFAIFSQRRLQQHCSAASQLALRKLSSAQGWAPTDDVAAAELVFRVENELLTCERTSCKGACNLAVGDSITLPCVIQLGEAWLGVVSDNENRTLQQLNKTSWDDSFNAAGSTSQYDGPSASTVTKWLADTAKLHRSSAGSTEFYDDAAKFAVETAGLDGAWILRRSDETAGWQIAGSYLPQPEKGICYDPAVLAKLETEPATWYQPADDFQALKHPQAAVAAPVLDEDGNLIGAVYAVRNISPTNRRRGIRPLEARLVQLLADSVAVGIARLQSETEAARTRVLLEHAFSPNLAEYIQQHPQSLSGQQRDVTLMFADLRGYSTLAETLELADCYTLLGDVMESLTQSVVDQRGIVVDYYGDGLLALWNAPVDQPNHADLACQAALEMFDALQPLNDLWQDKLDTPLALGIGIHSGPTVVGNAGTRSRLKYGPRGNTVNVANRVQAATKQLQLPLVITAATQAKLSSEFFSLRVCTAKLPGLEQAVELFTPYPSTEAGLVRERLDEYAEALQLFESGDLEAAEAKFNQLSALGPSTPARYLAEYAASHKHRTEGRRATDQVSVEHSPVIEILSK